MDAETVQSVLAFGTALSGLGSCAAAYFTARAERGNHRAEKNPLIVSHRLVSVP